MPLIHSKSKQAVGKNIEKEQEAGKPHDQAIAIALEVQRKARQHKASGGQVEHEIDANGVCMSHGGMCGYADGGTVTPAPTGQTYAERFQKGFLGQKKADGGFIEPQPLPVLPDLSNESKDKPHAIFGIILNAIKKKKK